jgi:glycosyltransferase involved in cell wall biosynthesis
MKISVTIITFNEEQDIDNCIQSVLKIADEIIIVDSFSTDKTIDICKKYTSNIYLKKFNGYGEQKQFATEKATNDYILSLDADEVISDTLLNSIIQIKSEEENIAGYTFNRLNFYCGKPIKHCGWHPDVQLRLFNKRLINWNKKSVHEKVEKNGRITKHLKGDLFHYTCKTVHDHVEKEYKYALMNGVELSKKNKKISSFTPYFKFIFRFLKTYVLKLGWLDGHYGFVISKTLAHSSFLKYNSARHSNKK